MVISHVQTTRMAWSLTWRKSYREIAFVWVRLLSIINLFILIVRAVSKIESCLSLTEPFRKSWKEMVSPWPSQENVAVLTCRISRLHLWLANMIIGYDRFKDYHLYRSKSVDLVAGCSWSEMPRSTVRCSWQSAYEPTLLKASWVADGDVLQVRRFDDLTEIRIRIQKPEWIQFIFQVCTWASLRQADDRDQTESKRQPRSCRSTPQRKIQSKYRNNTEILRSVRDLWVHEGISDSNSPFPSKQALDHDLDAFAKAYSR